MKLSLSRRIDFIKSLRKLGVELSKLKDDNCIDAIKELFLDNVGLLEETSALNSLISKLIVLSEKNISLQEAEDFVGILSVYWLECLMALRFYIVFFGEHDSYARLTETLSTHVAGGQFVQVDKQTDLDSIDICPPDNGYIVAVFDDCGSEFLKIKSRFLLHEIIYMNDLYKGSRQRVVKDDIASLLNKHALLQKKHYILFPVHEWLIDREKCFGL